VPQFHTNETGDSSIGFTASAPQKLKWRTLVWGSTRAVFKETLPAAHHRNLLSDSLDDAHGLRSRPGCRRRAQKAHRRAGGSALPAPRERWAPHQTHHSSPIL